MGLIGDLNDAGKIAQEKRAEEAAKQEAADKAKQEAEAEQKQHEENKKQGML